MRRTQYHFQKELLPPPRTFFERELGRLSRPDRKGRSRANCPFHQSKSRTTLSVNLNTGAFFCFSCGAHGGDLVDFVRQRDNVSFKAAAQSLGAWDSAPSPEVVRALEAKARERDRQRQIEEQREAEVKRERMELRADIHRDVRWMREASERLGELHAGAEPETPNEEEAAWAVLDLCLTDLRMAESAYCLASGLEDPYGDGY
jgi:CHC2 zinc finger